MNAIKPTYAKVLVSKKDSRYTKHPSYLQLEEMPGGLVMGFTYVIPERGAAPHIELCNGTDWDRCHSYFSTDKECIHDEWHSMSCSHLANPGDECKCSWKNN